MSTWPKLDKFLSEDEIVENLLQVTATWDGREVFICSKAEDLCMLHHGFGTRIRNTYHLWHPENPHTMLNYRPEIRNGADCSPRHPDQMSMRIIEKLHTRLNQQNTEAK